MSCIQTQRLCKQYPNTPGLVLEDVYLTVEAGEFAALMGPSGCGKSTLLNLLGAIDTPSSGEIQIFETTITALNEDARTRFRGTRVGYVFQFFNLLDALTVRENVLLPIELHPDVARLRRSGDVERRLNAVLRQVNLLHRQDHYPNQLSGGEMQRTAIARALIHNPPLILADEPTGNLDSANGKLVLEQLRELADREGKTILMATHSEEAARFAHRVMGMKDGRIHTSVAAC